MDDPGVLYFVAESGDGEVAAFAILCGVGSAHRSLELKRIVARLPNEGVGGEMLRWLLGQCFGEFNAHHVWLDVFEDNARAQHVYQNSGFGGMAFCGRRRGAMAHFTRWC